jgi:hypothetical protein
VSWLDWADLEVSQILFLRHTEQALKTAAMKRRSINAVQLQPKLPWPRSRGIATDLGDVVIQLLIAPIAGDLSLVAPHFAALG